MVEFSFGMPVWEKNFFNRVDELKKLVSRIEKIKKGARNDMAIIGPRRVGKSSLTNKLSQELEKKGITPIRIDCEGLTAPVFLREYSNAIIASEVEKHGVVQRFRENIKRGLSSSVAILSEALGRIGSIEMESPLVDFLSLRIEIENTPQSELKGEKLLNFFSQTIELPEKMGSKFVVIFDEFQETTSYSILKKGDFHALFRRAVQNQKNVAYVYTGSSIGMMQDIFGDPVNPLAGNADLMVLAPFDEKNSEAFIKTGLKHHGVQIDKKALKMTFEKTGGFPAYLNWIGLKLLDINKKNITQKEVNQAVNEMLGPASPVHQGILKQMAKLGIVTKKILREIALGNYKPPKIQKEVNIENVYMYLKRLQAYGLVKKQDKGFYLIDPVIAEGLRRGEF